MKTSTTTNTKYDLVIIDLPYADNLVNPPTAGAVLKGIAEANGFKVKTIDFNMDLRTKFCNSDNYKYQDTQKYYVSTETLSKTKNTLIHQFYDYIIDTLSTLKFRYLGISVFSMMKQKAVLDLCTLIRERHPEWKIVLGGKGLDAFSYLAISKYIAKEEMSEKFSQIVLIRNLADKFIIGEGEEAIVKLLKSKYGIDNFVDLKWNDASPGLKYPYPNWDDYDLSLYDGVTGKNDIQLSLITSKGCVRKCDFCNVPQHFSGYKAKDGGFLASEMEFLAEKYNISDFTFADSIGNGNMKALKEFCEGMSVYNANHPDKKVTWGGNWIARRAGVTKPEFYTLLKQAGAHHLAIGAEHGSDVVLKAMNKKTDVQGLLWEMDNLSKNKIQGSINSITAHWAETPDAFEEHCETMLRLGPKFANGTITDIKAYIFKTIWGSPVVEGADESGIKLGPYDYSQIWYYPGNPNLTLRVRLNRFYLFLKMCLYVGFPIKGSQGVVSHLVQELEDTWDEWHDFAKEHIDIPNIIPCRTLDMNPFFEQFTEDKIAENFKTTKLRLSFKASASADGPRLYIKINGSEVLRQTYEEGKHTVDVELENNYNTINEIVIGMDNKNPTDTIVDENGNIIKDKFIEFDMIELDEVNILDDANFYYNGGIEYQVEGNADHVCPGLYLNSEIHVKYDAPFWRHFLRESHINPLGTDHGVYDKDLSRYLQALDSLKQFIDRYEF